MDGGLGRRHLDADLAAAAQRRGERRLAHGGVAGVDDEDGVCGEELRTLLDERGKTGAAALLRALDEELQVQLGATGFLDRAQRREVRGDVALAVRCTAAEPARRAIGVRALGQREGIGLPRGRVTGRDDVVVRVEQHGLRALVARAVAQDGDGAVGGGDGLDAKGGIGKRAGNPRCGILVGLLVARLIVDGGEANELGQVLENPGAIAADGASNISHGSHYRCGNSGYGDYHSIG